MIILYECLFLQSMYKHMMCMYLCMCMLWYDIICLEIFALH